MKKTLFTILICLVMIFSITACSLQSPTQPTTPAQTDTPKTTQPDTKSSQPEVTLVYAEVNPLDSIVGKMAVKFKEKIEELSGGKMTLDIQHSGVLGAENDVLDTMLGGGGTVDMSRISAFSLTSYGGEKSKLLALPFTFVSREHFWNFANSDLAPEFLLEPHENGSGVRGLFYGEEGFRHFFSSKDINGMEDLKGMKIRVSVDPVMTGMVEALGNRGDPKGLVETVYERSLVTSDGFQSGRLRCYYDKETGDFYWMLSGYMQEQDLYSGTTGTGMNPGLQNVMLSDSITKLQSGEHTVDIYNEDGTRKTREQLETEGIKLAIHWLTEAEISTWIYANLVGLEEECKLIGETSDGTEFVRTYTFYFVDAGIELFDPNFRYCVVNGIVQRDLTGYNILTYIAGDNGTILGEEEQAVKHGEDGSEVTAVPDEGYHFVKWSDGITDNPRTDTNVTENITV
jgi:predicted small lipoprotein YifL